MDMVNVVPELQLTRTESTGSGAPSFRYGVASCGCGQASVLGHGWPSCAQPFATKAYSSAGLPPCDDDSMGLRARLTAYKCTLGWQLGK
jgi:hypothetical protein